jgi:hypothetical protein
MGDAGWDNPMTVNGKRIDPTPHNQVGAIAWDTACHRSKQKN